MNTQPQISKSRKGEQGNVLFLILIAVALFAALSYAVTQSTRSGGGDASSEKSLVSSAALTQYPASLKTSILRMTVSNGIDMNNLNFEKPGTTDYTALVPAATETGATAQTARARNAIFHPDGGGATYTNPAKDVAPANTLGWIFNANNEVQDIGTSTPVAGTTVTANTADIMAILPDVSKGICDKVHEQLGIDKVYPTIALELTPMDTSTPGIFGTSTGNAKIKSTELNGQPQGCVLLSANRYAYYHVLIER